MPEDRRTELRRLDDVRELLRFCLKFGQSVPSKVAQRLEQAGVRDAERRPIPELLAEIDALERPLVEALPADRRVRRRRWVSRGVEEEEEEL